MKILLLGSHGMAGHMITKYLQYYTEHQVVTVARKFTNPIPHYLIDIESKLGLNDLESAIIQETPDVIINCIGLLVQTCKENPSKAIYINSYFPHWLEKLTEFSDTKIIHLSTDCVFSGNKGNYSETDLKDGEGFYAQSKALGEIVNNKDLTLRLSIIGPELKPNGTGLFNCVMSQEGIINGYNQVFWNGITTLELAKQIMRILKVPNLTGLYQLAPDFKISKYNLLRLINITWNKNIAINPDDMFNQDKTLSNSRESEYNPLIFSYETQLKDLYKFMERHHEVYQLLY